MTPLPALKLATEQDAQILRLACQIADRATRTTNTRDLWTMLDELSALERRAQRCVTIGQAREVVQRQMFRGMIPGLTTPDVLSDELVQRIQRIRSAAA